MTVQDDAGASLSDGSRAKQLMWLSGSGGVVGVVGELRSLQDPLTGPPVIDATFRMDIPPLSPGFTWLSADSDVQARPQPRAVHLGTIDKLHV